MQQLAPPRAFVLPDQTDACRREIGAKGCTASFFDGNGLMYKPTCFDLLHTYVKPTSVHTLNLMNGMIA